MAVTYRQGTLADSRAVFGVFMAALADLSERQGVSAITGDDPSMVERIWQRRRSLFDHLARTAELFWIAEIDGEIAAYARSIMRGGTRELTEFFVLPDKQAAGLGRELFARAFPTDGATHRSIIATGDLRAQALYLKAKVYPRCPIVYFSRPAAQVEIITSDLTFERLTATPEQLAQLAELDAAIIGFRRNVDHQWLMAERRGYLYKRGGAAVGYGYNASSSGPFALLVAGDFPAVLAHAESEVVADGRNFGVEVPLHNQAAVDYMLERGFRMDNFMAYLMTDAPLGKYENYIFTSPPFFA